MRYSNVLLPFIYVMLASVSFAQPTEEDPWLVRKGSAEISESEFLSYLAGLEKAYQGGFMQSRKRVAEALDNLLLNEQLVNEALSRRLDQDEKVQLDLERARQRVLIDAFLTRLSDENAQGDVEQLAYEEYLANKDQYALPATVDISHLLIKTDSRDEAQALADITDIYQQLHSGTLNFEEAVLKYSEDPSKGGNQGRFPSVQSGQMVPPFEEAAFALTTPGEISKPVKTQFGYHIILLNEKHPARIQDFSEVKDALVKKATSSLRAKVREDYLNHLRGLVPAVNEEALQKLLDRYEPVNISAN